MDRIKKIFKGLLSFIKKMIKPILIFGIICLIYLVVANIIVIKSTEDQIYNLEDFKKADFYQSLQEEPYEAIIVLGCGVHEDGTPSAFLSDRLDVAIDLYKCGVAKKLLMSGDHGRNNYNEVGTMRQYAIDRGVPSEDIFMDHAGFSTYETMYRADYIFGIKKAIVVTQEYHLNRSLFDAKRFDIDVYGVKATEIEYDVLFQSRIRELLARSKEVIWYIIKPKPTYLGDTIDISGNGEVTLD